MVALKSLFESLLVPLFLLLLLSSVDRESLGMQWHFGNVALVSSTVLNLLYFALLALLSIRVIDLFYWKKVFVRKQDSEVPKLTQDLISGLVWIIFLILFILVFSDKPETYTGVFATSSVMIAIIGFAMRDLVADFFSGIAIGLDKQIRLGDWIDVGNGTVGKVVQINWRMMRIVTRDNLLISIPSSLLLSNILHNYNRPDPLFRESIELVLPHHISETEVSRLLLSAMLQNLRVRSADRQPDVLLMEFTERGIVWKLRFWLDDYEKRDSVRHDIMVHIQKNLMMSDIEIPPELHRVTMERAKSATRDFSIRTTLENIELFNSLAPRQLDRLSANANEQYMRAEDIICHEGETSDSLFVLAEGVLEVRKQIEGADTHLATLSVGDFFGEFSLLTGEPRSATISALGDARLFEITKEAIEPILCENPDLVRRISTALAERKMQNSQLYHSLEEEKRQQRKEKFISTYIEKIVANFSL